jgi:pimeloyl-ACP methyl ester carboxylesterase
VVLAGDRPNLIAHSFGTWIAVKLMKRPGVSFNRVVFAGSPLPANFDWQRELADNPRAFYDLTNERGLRDGVIAMAGRAWKVCAGEVGFKGSADFIHDTGALRDSCPRCRDLADAAQARIHNLSWKDFKHSDWFVGSGHSANLWLPYFWGFPPGEYSEFVETCLRLAEMEHRGEWLGMKQEEKEFRARGWSWSKRDHVVVNLDEYVKSNGICLPPPLQVG